jgi:hypothetical protein
LWLLFCQNGFSATLVPTVDVNTLSWIAKFANFNCPCTDGVSRFRVVVHCKDPALCPGEVERTFEFNCCLGVVCPTINAVNVFIGSCTNDNATSCGYRNVTFTPIICGTPTFYLWDFGDGTPNVSGSGVPGQETHKYFKPPLFTPKLTLFTQNCNPITVVYAINGVTFGICDACPVAAQIVINSSSSQCNLTGTISANFCEEQYNSFLVDYGDNTSVTETNMNLLNGYVINHTYSTNGTFPFKITLQKNGGNCVYAKQIVITGCKGTDGDGDGCTFCFCSNFWCCLLYILFILGLIATIVSLAWALCTNSMYAWIAFWADLAAVILLAILLITVCSVGICALLIALGIGGLINWAIVCGTNLIPCNSWLCQMTTIPILGVQVQNFLIINLVIWLLALILCAA